MTTAKRKVGKDGDASGRFTGGTLAAAAFAVVLFWPALTCGFVSIHDGGHWPADWPAQLEPYRARAKTFEIGTGGVRESVYEFHFDRIEGFEQIWPIILGLRSAGGALRVSHVEESGQGRTEVLVNDAPVVRVYAPVYGSSAQKPGGKSLPVGPPWPQSIMLPDGTLPEYVAISDDGTHWVPVVGKAPVGFRHRARIDIELVADGRVLDPNRILVPPEIPIVDNRKPTEPKPGTTWFVSPRGVTENPGTADAPWDLASTLAGRREVKAGDTICLLEGTYRRRPNELFEVRLAGAETSPIEIRPAVGQRVRIDGGLSVLSPSAHVWIRDLEIFVSEPLSSPAVAAGSGPVDPKRLVGGLVLQGGSDCKYINLVIYRCSQGISCRKGERNPEIYGCIVYDNGWAGSDQGDGHCIYAQDSEGARTISNCVMTCSCESCHAGRADGAEQAYVNNCLLSENICYERGPLPVDGARPSEGTRVRRNVLYGIDMMVGYGAPQSDDGEVSDDAVVTGEQDAACYREVVWDGNLILPSGDAKRPSKDKSVLLPNRYDRNRAHLVVFNWDGATQVVIETGACVNEGDTVELFDPEDLFGDPVAKLVCRDGKIHVPVCGEFAVFVVKIRRR